MGAEEGMIEREEALRISDKPEGEIEGNEETRVMGFGEYHHWAYGRVIREKTNYVAYIGMESERMGAPQKLLPEWLHGQERPLGRSKELWKKERIPSCNQRRCWGNEK